MVTLPPVFPLLLPPLVVIVTLEGRFIVPAFDPVPPYATIVTFPPLPLPELAVVNEDML
jgi:hypothetical protein